MEAAPGLIGCSSGLVGRVSLPVLVGIPSRGASHVASVSIDSKELVSRLEWLTAERSGTTAKVATPKC